MPSKFEERDRAEKLLRRLRIWPIRLDERESPDFRFEWEGKSIGLEVTEGVHQEYRRGERLKHSLFPDCAIDLTHLKDRSRGRSNKELTEQMLGRGNEWETYDVALKDWEQRVERSLEDKRKKLNTRGYTKFAENWLLIHDEPGLSRDRVTYDCTLQQLRALFMKPAGYPFDFDAIYILSGEWLFRSCGGEVQAE